MKIILLTIAICIISITSTAQKNKYFSSFEKANEVDPDSVYNLTIRDKIDFDNFSQITKYKNLNRLCIENTSFIPKEIKEIPNLKELQIGRAFLKDVSISEIPDWFSELDIEVLHIYWPNIIEAPLVIGEMTNLKEMSLWGFGFEKLPDSYSKLQQLEIVSLFGSKISELPVFFGKMPNLKEIDIAATNITSIPSALQKGNRIGKELIITYNKNQKFDKATTDLLKTGVLKNVAVAKGYANSVSFNYIQSKI